MFSLTFCLVLVCLDRLKPTNCLGILRFARHYFCNDLEEEGKRYVRHNFIKLLNEGTEFDQLSLNEVVELLEDEELNITNEEIVYEAIRRWVGVDPNSRQLHLDTLLKFVRFGHLPSSNVKKLTKNPRRKLSMCIPQNLGTAAIPTVWSEFLLRSQLCDGVVICEDGAQFKIHRVILSAVSSYFKAHFTNSLNGGLPENTEARVSVSSNIFKSILDFAYTGYCNIEPNTVEHLLKAADQYNILGVIQLCCRYVLDQLKPTNCLGILRFARHYFCKDLEKEGKRYVRHNFIKLLNEGTEFDQLSLNEVVELLEDEELNVTNEEIVYEAIRRWVGVDLNSRQLYLVTLLKCVRFGHLPTDFVSSNVMKWSLVSDNLECTQYLSEVAALIKNENGKVDVNNILWKHRVSYDVIFAIGGLSNENPTNIIETYNTRTDRWLLSVDNDTIPRLKHGLCALNGFIYMIGGYDGHKILNTVRCFDPINHRWTECACMHYPRTEVSVVMHDNKIYAMGGSKGPMDLKSVERYDSKRNQWKFIKSMQMRRVGASAAVLNDKIYIVGGNNGFEVTSSAEVYDILLNQWTFIPDMCIPRRGLSLIAFKNTLYAVGGGDGYTTTFTTGEKYTPGTSTAWTEIAQLSGPRSYFATVILNDFIYVIGGFNRFSMTTINDVEFYDTDSNEWFKAPPMNIKRGGLSACVISGLPNAKDYCYLEKQNSELGQGAGLHQDVN